LFKLSPFISFWFRNHCNLASFLHGIIIITKMTIYDIYSWMQQKNCTSKMILHSDPLPTNLARRTMT
jgi:hypothetical protein